MILHLTTLEVCRCAYPLLSDILNKPCIHVNAFVLMLVNSLLSDSLNKQLFV